MPRAVRWQTALPWALGLVAVLLVSQFLLARLVRWGVRHSADESIHAKVDIGAARVSLLNRTVTLHEIAVANPHVPLRNLIAADRCELHFDASELLHKRAVVRHGSLTGIRFDAPRKSNGARDGQCQSTDSVITWLDESSATKARDWLQRLHQKFNTDLVGDLETIRLTEDLVARLPEKHADLHARVEQLHQRTVEFQVAVRKAQTNPLRHADFLERMPDEIKSIQAALKKLTVDVENLPNMLDDDRRAIVAARQHDEQFLAEHLQFERIDANLLTAYLLHGQLSGPLADMVGWLHWMRRVLPAEASETIASRGRGEDVFFAGCRPSTAFLIRSLDLRGTARIGGRQMELLGTVTDFASQPRRHGQPLRVRLTTAGPLPLELQATLDRTGPVARDQFLVDCSGLLLPKLQLGDSDNLRLNLAPCSASLNLSITIEGDRLSGDIQLVRKNVQITPVMASELAHAGVEQALADSLGQVRSLATRVSMRGTLDEPQCQLWSNVGPAVAEAMDRALTKTAKSYRGQMAAEAQQRVDERLAELDRRASDEQMALFPQLAESSDTIAALTASEERPPRLSIEHLGRRLPADSLFR